MTVEAQDAERAGLVSLRALPLAIGLAFAFLIGQVAISVVFAAIEDSLPWPMRFRASEWLSLVPVSLFIVAHALFILIIANASLPKEARFATTQAIARAAILLSAAFAAIGFIDAARHPVCADGSPHFLNAVPPWPWTVIGWGVLTLAALPLRLLAWLSRRAFLVVPIWKRALYMAPATAVVAFLGAPFEALGMDCSRPVEGTGPFEGGLFVMPVLGLFLFVMSTSMALLSAAFISPSRH